MKSSAIFYHASCPVCVDAESMIASSIDQNQYDIEYIHTAEKPDRITEAELFGVRSVPAIVINNQVFHINEGVSIADEKGMI